MDLEDLKRGVRPYWGIYGNLPPNPPFMALKIITETIENIGQPLNQEMFATMDVCVLAGDHSNPGKCISVPLFNEKLNCC